MRWKENLLNISKREAVGRCPECGSENTDYKCTVVVPEKKLGYMDVWCNECKSACHISRLKITENLKKTGTIPNGLKY